MGAALAVGSSFWERAWSQTAQPGDSPYGPLLPADSNSLQLPEGFTSRIVAASLTPVAGTAHVWHVFPDGGACVPTDDGGWSYVSNSENPPPVDVPNITPLLDAIALASPVQLPTSGGVGAIRFDSDGTIVNAYSILTGSRSNCAGGLTPWGTWLTCEEWEDTGDPYAAGRVWECDPAGGAPTLRPSLGLFKHEMAACDPVRGQIYLSEDQPDGLFYRYTPPPGTWGSGDALDGGTMEAMVVAVDGTVGWVPVANADAPTAPLRTSTAGATPFVSGEGVIYDDDRVYLTTKPPDDKVWVFDIAAQTMRVLYDATSFASPVLNGVDNIVASKSHDLYVAEDGGNLEICVITPDLAVFPVVRMTGPRHGVDNPTPVPLISEVTGLAFSPDGNRLYFNSERGQGFLPAETGPGPGILYEVTGPFRGGSLAAQPLRPVVDTRPALPATGANTSTAWWAALGGAAAAAVWKLLNRGSRSAA